jgi:tmRNA-binding protein
MNLQEDIQRIQEVMGVDLKPEIEPVYDFYKTVYNPEDKSITGAYMITGEDDNSIQVMNIKEMIRENRIYMDNAKEYNLNIQKFDLPKSQIQVLGEDEDMQGFHYIKIPYWLYKKMIDQLEIVRVKGKKRPDVTYSQSRNNNFLMKLNDPDVIKYISITNPDKSGIANLQYAAKRYKPEE